MQTNPMKPDSLSGVLTYTIDSDELIGLSDVCDTLTIQIEFVYRPDHMPTIELDWDSIILESIDGVSPTKAVSLDMTISLLIQVNLTLVEKIEAEAHASIEKETAEGMAEAKADSALIGTVTGRYR